MEGLFKEVSLFEDILADETQERSPEADAQETSLPNSDFRAPEPFEPEPQDEEEPYDAEAEARKLVSLISMGNTVALMPIADFKVKKNYGGKKSLARMMTAVQKEFDEKQLSEADKKQLQRFEQYKAARAMLMDEIPFSKQEEKTLLEAAKVYCESSKIKVNVDLAFWGALVGIEGKRIFKILAA